jgi:hypothetical protein
MERQPVKSSNIHSIGYELATRTLEVEYNAGGIYQYLNLSERLHTALMQASSKGTYLSERIKNRYRCKKIR